MPDKFCESCEWWEHVYDSGHEKWGECSNDNVQDKLKVTQDFESVDGTNIMTERNFGCMYHEKKDENVLFKIDVPKK